MKKILLIFMFCVGLFAADSTMTIVNKGAVLPKIIVQDASNLSDKNLQNKFFRLMVGDLKVGATFEVSDKYLQSSYEGDYKTNIADGSPELIARYAVSGDKNGAMNLKVKVLNGKNGKNLFEGSFDILNGEKFPFLAHRAVSTIIKKLGYSNVDWMNNMIVISRYLSPKQTEILVTDYTLTYQKVVVKGGMNIFPKWANANQTAFYYTNYINNFIPVIFKYDMTSGNKSRIFTGKGMAAVSDISSDGRKLLITNAPNDQPDIYLYDLISKNATQLTKYSGIDVSANFIDNDSRIVFVSDRLGYPNIFAKNINGGPVEEIVFHGRNNNSLSSNKNYIVYSSRERAGEFNLYLMSTQTDYVRQLTGNGKNIFPRFSKDGGSIIYIKESSSGTSVGIIRVNENRSFQYPMTIGQLQSVDW